ncbi:MAG: ABC transporter permease, partial [Acidobacteriota bacterium]|nr:ABC transporter permease [Acidobacteriota bacterium]
MQPARYAWCPRADAAMNAPLTLSIRFARAIGGRVYRILLLAYPAAFRAEHGDEAAALFADACADGWTAGGVRSFLLRLARAIVTVPRDGIAERLGCPDNPRRRDRIGRIFAELGSDVRYAGRSIRRRPMLSAGVIVTLGIGIGSNTAMFAVIDATLLRPLPYRDADRVVYIRTQAIDGMRSTDPTTEDLQRWAPRLTSLDRVEARAWRSVLLTGDEGATRVRMLQVSAGYLNAVGSRPIAGRGLQADDSRAGAPPVVAISEQLWRTRYATRTDIIGRTVKIDSIARVVVGVISDVTSDIPGLRFSVFASLPGTGAEARETTALGIGWLKKGVGIDAARAELQSISASVDARGRVVIATLERPTNVFWEADELRDPQVALMAGVFLLLLIAWSTSRRCCSARVSIASRKSPSGLRLAQRASV